MTASEKWKVRIFYFKGPLKILKTEAPLQFYRLKKKGGAQIFILNLLFFEITKVIDAQSKKLKQKNQTEKIHIQSDKVIHFNLTSIILPHKVFTKTQLFSNMFFFHLAIYWEHLPITKHDF